MRVAVFFSPDTNGKVTAFFQWMSSVSEFYELANNRESGYERARSVVTPEIG